MLHVVPLYDLKEHDLDSTACWCKPRVEWEDPDTGTVYAEALIIHNSADHREVVEEAEVLINAQTGDRL